MLIRVVIIWIVCCFAAVAEPSLSVTKGANAGFVDDQQCASCHQDKHDSFQHVGMAKSFKTPKAQHVIENFDVEPFYHKPSQRYYRITRKGDDLWFARYQLDEQQKPINVFKQQIDYMIGSGNKTRSYFYRTDIGEMYLLPLSWYSGINSWQMSPGFEKADHIGVSRQVTRECMFCHNALPEVPKNSDWHWQAQTFPKKLPQGIGCQRCHGPGAEHIKTVMSGKADLKQIHASIVNPVKLAPEKRDSVCFQCHMLPAVNMAGVRQYDRAEYSFRAGQHLKDFIVHVDVEDANIKRENRFEINHHGYRLASSECFKQSAGKLTCINCHNPHKKVADSQKVAHYKKACLACHQGSHLKPQFLKDKPLDDCTSCHMPQRRAQDVVHALMTDHRIGSYQVDDSFTAAIEKPEPALTGIELFFDYPDMSAAQKEMYKVSAVLRATPSIDYVNYLKGLLVKHQPQQLQPYFDLIEGQIAIGDNQEAFKTITFVEQKFPGGHDGKWKLQQSKVKVLIALKQFEPAFKLLIPLLKQYPDVPEHHLYQGILLHHQGAFDKAILAYQQSCKLRPVMVTCWFNLGQVYQQQKLYQQAMEAYQQALAIDPNIKAAYLAVADVAVKTNQRQQAMRYLRHGIKLFGEDQSLVNKLMNLTGD